MLQLVDGLEPWRRIRSGLGNRSLGFVPTMGALHHGHASLLDRSVRENDVTVASIYVNPTQFDQPDDLEHYPRTLDADCRLAGDLGVDYVLCPRGREIYPDDYVYKVTETSFSRRLCGAHRQGHFDGVLTVVLKLLNLVRPHRAYFGEKDFQQLELVRGMAEAFFLEVEIVGCPTVREADGLAASSRNLLLTPDQRRHARIFPQLLSSPGTPEDLGRRLAEAGFRVDYLEETRGRRCGAVHLGEVRLIDNLSLQDISRQDTVSTGVPPEDRS